MPSNPTIINNDIDNESTESDDFTIVTQLSDFWSDTDNENSDDSDVWGDDLEALSRAFIGYFHEHRDFLRMQLQLGAAWADGAIPAKAHHHSEVAAEIHDLQLRIFQKGVATGAFIEEDPAYLETLFSGIDQIHLGHWLSHGGKESVEELTDSFLRILRRTFVRTDN